MSAKKCLICSSSFSGRRDAKTCSARCRKRLQLVRLSVAAPAVRKHLAKAVAVMVVGLFGLLALIMSGGQSAQAATSSYFNFQMRLLTSSGAVVSDGNYHIEFKLYNAANSTGSSQGSCTGDANCLWTETRTTGNLVRVVNGYFSVQLGSVTVLPSVNWNQELWLGVRIGGSGGTASWEANELTSDGTATGNKIALTAVPYAFTARELQMTSGSFTNTLLFATPSGSSKTITLPNETGTVCTTGSVCTGYQAAGTTTLQNAYDAGAAGDQVIALDATQDSLIFRNPASAGSDSTYVLTIDQLSTAAKGGLSIQSAGTGNLLLVTDTTATARDVLTIADGGATTFRNQTDSTTAFQVQNAISSTALSVGTTPLNTLINNGSVEGSDNSNWANKVGTTTQSRVTTQSYIGSASEQAVFNSTVTSDGVKYVFSHGALSATTTYMLTFYLRENSGDSNLIGTNLQVGFNSGSDSACTLTPALSGGGGVGIVPTTGWNRYRCTITTDGTPTTSDFIYWQETDNPASTRTFFIDAIQLELTSTVVSAFQESTLNLNGVITSPVALRNNSDSSTAFQIQTASGSRFLNVDTQHQEITFDATYSPDGWNPLSAWTTTVNGSSASYNASLVQDIYVTDNVTGNGGNEAYGTNYNMTAANDGNSQNLYATAISLETHSGDGGTGVIISNVNNGSTSTGGQQYGVYIDLNDSDVTSYGIYQKGSVSQNYFGGNTTFKSETNSATFFQIQNTGGNNILAVDSTKGVITQPFVQASYLGGADVTSSANSGTGSAGGGFTAAVVAGRYEYAVKVTDGAGGSCSATAGSAIGCEFQIFDVSNPGSPTYKGGADVSGTTNGGTSNKTLQNIIVSGRYAYIVGDGNTTACSQTAGSAIGCELQVYDISNPSSPTYKGGVDISGSPTGASSQVVNIVAVSGRYLFMGTNGSATACSQFAGSAIGCELQVYDITNPTSPTYIGGADNSGTANSGTSVNQLYDISISGNYVYTAFGEDSGTCSATAGSANGCEFKVFDISDPTAPAYKGGADSNGTTNGGTTGTNISRAVVASGRYAYLSKDGDATACSQSAGSAIGCELQVYDISNPSSPTYVGGADSSGLTNSGTGSTSSAKDAFIAGRYLYMPYDADNGGTCSQTAGSAIGCELQVYDVSDPSSPTYKGGADASGTTNGGSGNSNAEQAFVSGRYVYVPFSTASATACSQTAGSAIGCELQIYDISGAEVSSLIAHSFEAGTLNVQTNGSITNNLNIGGSLSVGQNAAIQGDLGVGGSLLINDDILPTSAPSISTTSQTITSVATTGDVGNYVAMAMPADGRAVIAHIEWISASDNDIHVAKCDNASCTTATSTEVVDVAEGVAEDLAIAIGSDGLPIIVYQPETSGNLIAVHCGNANCTSGNTTTTLESINDVGESPSIAIGIDGFPIIAHIDQTNSDLRVYHCANVLCSSGTASIVDANGFVGQRTTAIAIGKDGMPVIAFKTTSDALRTAKCQKLDCSSVTFAVTVEDVANSVGNYISMVIGSDNNPFIVHFDATALDTRVYACGNGECSSGTASTLETGTGSVGQSGVAVGVDGKPVVAIYFGTADLEVAYCENLTCTSWNKTTIETTNDVGKWPSLAIGRDTLPIIAYADETSNDLRVAKCADIGCFETASAKYSNGISLGSASSFFRDVYAVNYFGKQFSLSGFDVAEEYEVEDTSLKPGEAVALNPTSGKLRRATATDRALLLGVISTQPGIALKDYVANRTDTRLIALVGKVPLKVKGQIGIGDPLTISNTPGVAAKATSAGIILGRAMQNFNGESGTITVYVQTSYYQPTVSLQGNDFLLIQDLFISGLARITNLEVAGDASFKGSIIVKGHYVTAGDAPQTEILAANTSANEPQITIDGNDTAGSIKIITIQSVQPGNLVKITFNQPFGKKPKIFLHPSNLEASTIQIYREVQIDYFIIKLISPMAADRTYEFDYFVIE